MKMPRPLGTALASLRRAAGHLPAGVGAVVVTGGVAAASLAGMASLSLFDTRVDRAPELPPAPSPWLVQRATAVDDSACQLSLRVLDDGGAPINNARLGVVRLDEGQVQRRFEATTDARGTHRLIDLPAGYYDVTVSVDGSSKALAGVPTFACDRAGKRAFHDVVVVESNAQLTGTMVGRHKKPLANAEVALWQTDTERTGLAGVVRIRTADDGTFTARLQPGRYVAYASAADHVSRKFDVAVDAAGTAVDMRLGFSPSARGIVVDESGNPLANAVVSMGGAFDPRARNATVKTDAWGRFSLPVQEGQALTLTARGDGRVARAVLGVVENVDRVQQLTLVATAGRTVQGMVYRTDGEPLAFGAVHYRIKALGLEGEANTDGGGRFVLDGMPTDQDVEVWAVGNATGAWGAQVASPSTTQLALTFVPPAW